MNLCKNREIKWTDEQKSWLYIKSLHFWRLLKASTFRTEGTRHKSSLYSSAHFTSGCSQILSGPWQSTRWKDVIAGNTGGGETQNHYHISGDYPILSSHWERIHMAATETLDVDTDWKQPIFSEAHYTLTHAFLACIVNITGHIQHQHNSLASCMLIPGWICCVKGAVGSNDSTRCSAVKQASKPDQTSIQA